jgi:peptidyl-prolyl cis-trans isomerase C
MKRSVANLGKIAGAVVLFAAGLIAHAADDTKPEPEPAQSPVTGDTVLVKVNGEPVRRALFDGLVKARSEQANPYDEPDADQASKPTDPPVIDREAVFDDLLTMEILAQKARERGIHLRPEVAAEAELQYKTLLQQELVRDIIAEIRVEPDEVAARYDAQPAERSYKVSHILLKTEAEARAVIRELDKGAQFPALARKRTLDANTRKDGMLGWMMASQLEQSFVAAVELLKPGRYFRQPVQTPYGWHVVQLHAARYLDKPPFATAQTWLRQEILYEKVNVRLKQIRQEARIDLPPPY